MTWRLEVGVLVLLGGCGLWQVRLGGESEDSGAGTPDTEADTDTDTDTDADTDTDTDLPRPSVFSPWSLRALPGVDIRVVGDEAWWITGTRIVSFDGVSMSVDALPDDKVGRAIAGTGPDDLWIVTTGGGLLTREAGTWSEVDPGLSEARDVWATEAQVWVVGDGVAVYDRSTWALEVEETPLLNAVWGNAEVALAVGEEGVAWWWEGETWTEEWVVDGSLDAVHGTGRDHAVVLAEGGLWVWNGNTWLDLRTYNSEWDGREGCEHATAVFTEGPEATWLAGANIAGLTNTWTASLGRVDGEPEDATTGFTGESSRRSEFRAFDGTPERLWVAGTGGCARGGGAEAWSWLDDTSKTRGLHVAAAERAWVARAGQLYSWGGETWYPYQLPDVVDYGVLIGPVWEDGDSLWLGTDRGLWRHVDGWTKLDDHGASEIAGEPGGSPVVLHMGCVRQWDGSSLELLLCDDDAAPYQPDRGEPHSIHVADGGAIWAAGEGSVYRIDGAMTHWEVPGAEVVGGVGATVVVGGDGLAAVWSGVTWHTTELPFEVLDIGGPSSTAVWAVGSGGSAWVWDGATWTVQATGTDARLTHVDGADGLLWVAGDRGTLLLKGP